MTLLSSLGNADYAFPHPSFLCFNPRAKLLQMRKISPPSESWLRQLPHKVRKLEERLYRSAPSLESYLDRKTLKARLKTLAKAITHQFKEAKMRLSSLHLSRSSIASHSTLASYGNLSTREAIASTRSQDLMSTEKTVIPMPVASTSNSETNNAQSLPLSPNQMSFRQLSAGSSVGDNHNSQRFSCGLSELDRQKAEGFHQQMIGCTWQSEELASCSQQKYLTESCPSKVTLPQNSLAPPLSVGGADATIGSHKVMGVNFPQNSFGNFVNSTQMMSGQSMPNTNPGVLNQGDMLNGMTLFGQPMNMMMLNSGNNSLLHPTMNAIQMQQGQLQQNQLQYALNSQQMHMFQQSNLDMMRGNPSFGIATQHNSMTPNYYMSNTVDPIMPPPPRIYQGSSTSSSVTESTTILKPSATPHSMGSGKSDTQL